MSTMVTEPVAALRQAGLRVTAPRIAVLEALAGLPDHPGAEAIAAAVRSRLGTVSTQTVYDVLHALQEAGLVRRLDIPGEPAACFELHRHDGHHHLSCTSCRKVIDVAHVEGPAHCLDVSLGAPAEALHGFLIEEAIVVFQGVCPECRQAGQVA
ncbi:Fur family transcriptional regulator [Sediminivirga luteola]|uniref:Transcriptional repressor n=1 Tax=Sediminivirga luteola TaxID=1774748 RepID=A0A8J2U0G1_9MICO|nr:Fur family transcriptional regulator [Sediminivirga luteola]MCI2265332.1 transcriptional repressor [Sediminivirga luteola]GGA24777.1 transcriptional repressor [Sediminivirga luteola]